jgi:hypothetical protein
MMRLTTAILSSARRWADRASKSARLSHLVAILCLRASLFMRALSQVIEVEARVLGGKDRCTVAQRFADDDLRLVHRMRMAAWRGPGNG